MSVGDHAKGDAERGLDCFCIGEVKVCIGSYTFVSFLMVLSSDGVV